MAQKIILIISYAGIFLAAAMMPFSRAFANIALAIVMVSTLISFIIDGVQIRPLKSASFYLFCPLIFFIPVFIGFFYSPMDTAAWGELRRMSFLLVLPALILRRDMQPQKALEWGKKGLIAGSVLSALVLLSINFYKIWQGPTTVYSIFSYYHTHFQFTKPLKLHPTYLGSYYVMAWVFLFFTTGSVPKWIRFLATVLLFTAILFLNARIIYGILFVILLLYLVTHFRLKVILSILFVAGIIFFLSLPYLKNTYIYEKMTRGTTWELSRNIETYSTDRKNPSDSRLSRWITAWSLVKEHPLIGSGTGTEQPRLNQRYKEKGMKTSREMDYNTHNQFLAFLIKYGALGLLLMVVFFIGNLYTAISRKHLDFLCFLLVIGGIFFVENYLERNLGIIFLGLFGSLFYFTEYA